MTDTEAQEAALRESLAPLRAIVADSQRMPGTQAPPHVHEWAGEPVEDARLFRWKCRDQECGETATVEWRPEFAGLGFEDVGRIMVAENGGRLAPPTFARQTSTPRAGFFPNPCPVCGATDEHEEWRQPRLVSGFSPATFCPHPAEPGHGTGCCCAGRAKPAWEYDGTIEPGKLKQPRSLAERVAALEWMAANPLMAVWAKAPEFTAEQEAQLRESLDALGSGGKPFEYKILPPAPLLTPELARELLRECVTVVKPGETLIVRVDRTWTPAQVKDVQEYADTVTGYRELGVTVLFLPGEEFAVAAAKPEECE